MARGIEGNEIGTQRAAPKKTGSSSTPKSGPKQSGIASFFQKRPGAVPSDVTPAKRPSDTNGANNASKAPRSSADLTPAPSSGAVASSSPPVAPDPSQQSSIADGHNKENGTRTDRA